MLREYYRLQISLNDTILDTGIDFSPGSIIPLPGEKSLTLLAHIGGLVGRVEARDEACVACHLGLAHADTLGSDTQAAPFISDITYLMGPMFGSHCHPHG